LRAPFGTLRQEVHDLVSTFFDEESGWPTLRMLPPLDLSETADAVEIRMELPGVEAKQVDIQLNQNMLTISGEKKEEREEKGKTWHRLERRTGSFSRSVLLPCPVKEDAIDARYRDGILTVTLPKCDEARAKKISVKS
jgi:HSP20 family protein